MSRLVPYIRSISGALTSIVLLIRPSHTRAMRGEPIETEMDNLRDQSKAPPPPTVTTSIEHALVNAASESEEPIAKFVGSKPPPAGALR